MKEALT